MYLELGAAVFSGIAVLIIAIPLNVVAGLISKKFQAEQMVNKGQLNNNQANISQLRALKFVDERILRSLETSIGGN